MIQNFTIGEDTLGFRLDGGYFRGPGEDGSFVQGERGDKLEQSSNGNQANFSSAMDLADLLLHVNYRGTVDAELKETGKDKTFRGFESAEAVAKAEQQVANGDIKKLVQAAKRDLEATGTDNSYVKVIGEHIVINIDDFKHSEDHYDKWGNFKTTDKTIVLEDFEEQLASEFARELGFDEFESNADSVHILGQERDPVFNRDGSIRSLDDPSPFSKGGGSGDNLFIMSAQQDTIQIDDRNTGNDENGHINILHGFDLTEDRISGRFDGGFFDGSNNATFEGAAGIAELLTFAESVSDEGGDLVFDLQSVGGGGNRDPLTFVLTETTLEDVYAAAQTQVFEALTASGAFPVGSIPPAPGGNGDDIVIGGNGAKGDDLHIATAGADTFNFDSRDGAEDGTGGTTDGSAHAKVVIGFSSEDALSFRIDGQFFDGDPADRDARLPQSTNGNQATFTADELDELGAFLNGTAGGNSQAFYEETTNSTIFVIDDQAGGNQDNDDLWITLWNSGDLL